MNNCGPANLGMPTATDDCGGSPAFTNNAPPKFFVGTTPVTWTATDLSGNHATATQTVTVGRHGTAGRLVVRDGSQRQT